VAVLLEAAVVEAAKLEATRRGSHLDHDVAAVRVSWGAERCTNKPSKASESRPIAEEENIAQEKERRRTSSNNKEHVDAAAIERDSKKKCEINQKRKG
jgi:hypothetical protein